nr:MAG: putative capsid protein [Arizlama virus]
MGGSSLRRGGRFGISPIGAVAAASSYRVRSRRFKRRRRFPGRRSGRKLKKFGRKVKRALRKVGGIGGFKTPPKWHIYRQTGQIEPSTEGFTALGQTSFDIVHGHQTHYDGLVALQCVATGNMKLNTTDWEPRMNNGMTKVLKSYMILYMTNNSSTPVYGKMCVARPRRHVNDLVQYPSPIAEADLRERDLIPNEAGNQYNAFSAVSTQYNQLDVTANVGGTSLTDMGWVWHNSVSFRRQFKAKIKEVNWAPMECKRFIFKFKRRVSIDHMSEYTMSPATSNANPNQWEDNPYYLLPVNSGFSEMHAKRGFFVSFLMHGIPVSGATPNEGVVGLTQPKMDLYWLNAYKYGWQAVNKREYHVSTPNPLGSITPQMVNFGNPTAGNVVTA